MRGSDLGTFSKCLWRGVENLPDFRAPCSLLAFSFPLSRLLLFLGGRCRPMRSRPLVSGRLQATTFVLCEVFCAFLTAGLSVSCLRRSKRQIIDYVFSSNHPLNIQSNPASKCLCLPQERSPLSLWHAHHPSPGLYRTTVDGTKLMCACVYTTHSRSCEWIVTPHNDLACACAQYDSDDRVRFST